MKNLEKMKDVRERQKLAWDGMIYSISRIDLLIISISGAGIYICLETIKYLSDKGYDASILIKLAGGLFLIAIVVNFIGQFLGFKTNEQDYMMCQAKIDAGEKPTESQQKEIDRYNKKSDRFTCWANISNYTSTGFMLAGLALVMVYFLFIF